MWKRGSESHLEQFTYEPDLLARRLEDDGTIPNSRLPLLVYRRAIVVTEHEDPAALFEQLFASHGWEDSWRNGIYSYHHYHSTAHEVLGIYSGAAKVQLGGEQGIVYEIHSGDVIVIPAGVAHKNLGSTADFGVVGAYPGGQEPDMNYGKRAERAKADANISRVPLPRMDPVYGASGPLVEKWAE